MTKQDLLTLYELAKKDDVIDRALGFITDVYELAHGADSVFNGYSSEGTLEILREYSDRALYTEQLIEEEDYHKDQFNKFLKQGYL